MSMLSKVRKASIVRFLTAFVSAPGVVGAPMLFENPSEEIEHAIASGKDLRLHYASAAETRGVAALRQMNSRKGDIRAEENYLFSSRRYPVATDNDLAAVTGNHIPPGTYQYFNYAVNQNAVGAGFPSSFQASYNET
ncbi:MAG TPA: hypothetical protein VE820_10240, partial [Sphingomicrobium sp.]|nr:hypothetical protein [Sphingomicrobium sp.]